MINENNINSLIQIDIKQLEEKYNFIFPLIFVNLWNDGMLDLFKGWDEPWSPTRNWFTEIYPTIKDNPPLLLHTNCDLEMLITKEMLHFEFGEWWDIKKHHFIPFARTGGGDVYAFYKNGVNENGEYPIVLIFHDNNCAQYLAKNFEEFIFRQMIETLAYYDGTQNSFFKDVNEFQLKIKADLKTVKRYLNQKYVDILEDLYSSDFSNFEHSFTQKKMDNIIEKNIKFDLLNDEFIYVLESYN